MVNPPFLVVVINATLLLKSVILLCMPCASDFHSPGVHSEKLSWEEGAKWNVLMMILVIEPSCKGEVNA